MAGLSCAPALRSCDGSPPVRWYPTALFRIVVVVATLGLAGCNANQPVNPSGQLGRCANDAACNPYNPSSYAQNNTGIGR